MKLHLPGKLSARSRICAHLLIESITVFFRERAIEKGLDLFNHTNSSWLSLDVMQS